jgi:hypothetical protein
MQAQVRIPLLDSVIILMYILVILAIGVFSRRQSKTTGQVFFFAGRSLPWGMAGAALFASNLRSRRGWGRGRVVPIPMLGFRPIR